jgi:hypothetical protein
MARNVCDCPSPPGGRAVCEIDQLAICRVVNGAAETQCIDPPDELTGNSLRNWLLERITGRSRAHNAPITGEDAFILSSGHYFDRRRVMEVTFALPHTRGEGRGFSGTLPTPIVPTLPAT